MRSLALLVALGFWWSVPSSNPFCTISTFANSVAASEPFARNRDADVAPALLKGIMGQIAGSQLNDSGTVYVPLQNPTEHFRYVNSVHVLHENLRELFLQNSVVNLEDVRQFLQLHYPSYLQDQLSALFDLLRSTDSSSKQSFIAKKDLLIVVNTKNRLYLTVILLKYLRGFQKFADLIIIDDHSADGSIDYLERKGYAVYRKHQTRGVWHSWRIGYKLAASMRYKCVVFIDQTIMISSQAVYNLIQNVLAKDDVRFHIPMISSANPFSPQSLIRYYLLPEGMQDYIRSVRYTAQIQAALSDQCKYSTRCAHFLVANDWSSSVLMKNKSYSINSDDGLVLGIKVSNNDLTNANDTGLTSQTRRPVVATTAFATSTQMLRQRLLQERNSHSVENCADSYNYSFLDPAELMITPLFDSISNRHRIVRMLIILADANDHYSDSVVAEALKQQLPALYFIEVTLIDGRNRSSWYNPHELSNTDIVINFNWRYSLKNAITAIKPTATVYNYFHLKPALIAIAWIPNVANQLPHETKGAEGKDQEDISSWLSHSFLGNYDGIISSENSMNFLNSYNHYFGFPVNCFQGCPVIMKYQKSNESELNDNSTEYITLSSKRRRVLIRKLDLDTEAIKLVVQLRDFLHRFGVVLQGKSATESEFDSNMEPTPQPTMLPKGLYPEEYKKLLRQEKKRKNDRSKPPLAANILANTRQLSRFFSEKSFLRNMRANSTNALNGPATKEEVLSSVLQEMKAADENHLNSDYSDGDDGKTQKVWDRTKRSSVCVGIRTVYSQRRWVEILLLSLLAQYEASPFSYNINFHIFVIDTEHSTAFQTLLLGLAAKLNEEYRKKYVHIVSERYSTRRSYQNPFYGYDSTDLLLPKMIEEYRTSIDKDDKNYENSHSNTSANSAATNTNCEWILLTNGDNMYNSALLDTIAPHLLNKEVEIIAWDFITHHLRKDIPNTPTTVAWKRKYIDLGCVIARAELYIQSETVFLPESVFTQHIFARDYFTTMNLVENVKKNGSKLIHQTLLIHQ